MRSGVVAFAAVVAAGLAALVLVAAGDERDLAFTLGVQPSNVAVVLSPGDVVCQGPIDVPVDAASVQLRTDAVARPRPALRVSVRDAAAREIRGAQTVPRGAGALVDAPVAGLEGGSRVSVCARNEGPGKVGLFGGPPLASRTSVAVANGEQVPGDVALVFHRSGSRSMLAALPDALDRAALFHASWLEPWMLWALAAILALGCPFLVARALAAARED